MRGPRADINVTPLIDVLLVLLVIFMLVTPLAHRGLDVALPRDATEPAPLPDDRPVVVMTLEATSGGGAAIALNRRPVGGLGELDDRLREYYEGRADKTLFVRAEGGVRYGAVVEAMDVARGAGALRIGIVSGSGEGTTR